MPFESLCMVTCRLKLGVAGHFSFVMSNCQPIRSVPYNSYLLIHAHSSCRSLQKSDSAANAIVAPTRAVSHYIHKMQPLKRFTIYAGGFRTDVYVLPKHLDEKVARLHLKTLGKLPVEPQSYFTRNPVQVPNSRCSRVIKQTTLMSSRQDLTNRICTVTRTKRCDTRKRIKAFDR